MEVLTWIATASFALDFVLNGAKELGGHDTLILSEAQNLDREDVILSEAKNLDPGTVIPSAAKNLDQDTVIQSEAKNLDEDTVILSAAQNLDEGTVILSAARNLDEGTVILSEAKNLNPTITDSSSPKTLPRKTPRQSRFLSAIRTTAARLSPLDWAVLAFFGTESPFDAVGGKFWRGEPRVSNNRSRSHIALRVNPFRRVLCQTTAMVCECAAGFGCRRLRDWTLSICHRRCDFGGWDRAADRRVGFAKQCRALFGTLTANRTRICFYAGRWSGRPGRPERLLQRV